MKARKKVPGEDDLRSLPRWARVALAARTLRRVQPLLQASWPRATQKFQRAVAGAITEGEHAATVGSTTPNLKDAGMAAMEVYGQGPMGAATPDYLAFAAARVSFAAMQSSSTLEAHIALDSALWASDFFEMEHEAPGVKNATLAAIWSDFQQLNKASQYQKWDDQTPVAPDFFGPLWPHGVPENWPAVTAPPLIVLGKRRRTLPVDKLGLPEDCLAFLRAGRQLEFDPRKTEIGPVRLKPLAHLRFDMLTVTTKGTPLERKDPHRLEKGYYSLKVVDLIDECDAYRPEGLLAWFCDYGVFGSWDDDHHTALVFPNASWTQIAADPVKYLDAQWNPGRKNAKYLEPWKHCTFKDG